MNRKISLILTILSIVNTSIVAFISFLTVFMYNNSIGQAEHIAGTVIFSCFIVAVLMKVLKRKFWTILVSLLSDTILVLFLYNLTDSDSFFDFVNRLLNNEDHAVVILYLFLIVYYFLILKDFNKTKLDRHTMT